MERKRPRDHRTEALHEMLLRYSEAKSESSGLGGGGSHHEARMNVWDAQTWTREYRELERCLDALRYMAEHGRPMLERNVSSSAGWWHLRHRYLVTDTVRREVFMRRTHSGERVPARLPANMEVTSRQTILNGKTSYMMVRVWDARVDPAVVGAALRFLAREFRGVPATYAETSA